MTRRRSRTACSVAVPARGTGNRPRIFSRRSGSGPRIALIDSCSASSMRKTMSWLPLNRRSQADQDLVEHRRRVSDRAADDLQHFRGRGLLLERFLRFVEQAHVLDRDHRLVGEGSDQRDLLVVERHGLAPSGDDRADHLAGAHHRRADLRVVAEAARKRLRDGRHSRIAGNRHDLRHLCAQHRASDMGLVVDRSWVILEHLLGARHAVECADLDLAVARQRDHGELGVEQAQQVARNRLEHRRRVRHRSAHRGQDLSGSRLSLKCLLRFLEQARVLDRDRRLGRRRSRAALPPSA